MKSVNIQGTARKYAPVYGVSLVLLASSTFAGGYKTYGVSTRAESMGNAFVAIANDASAVFYNPAGLLQIKETGMVLDFTPIFPYSMYTNSLNNISSTNHMPALGLSNFFSKRMNENVAIGAGIYAPFARSTIYGTSPALFNYNLRTLFVDVNITGVVAFKAAENLTLGMGPILNFDIVNVTALGVRQYALGAGISGVFSALYTINKDWKIGATYHLPSSMNSPGHGKGYLGPLYFNETFHLKYKNPGYVDVGIALQATKDWVLAFGAGMEFWQQASNARYIYKDPFFNNSITFNPKDIWNFHVGTEYYFQPGKALRLGYSFYPRPTPAAGILPGALDFSANVFAIGYGYQYNEKLMFNAGYEHATSRDVISWAPLYNPFVGRYHARVNTIMLGANYQV